MPRRRTGPLPLLVVLLHSLGWVGTQTHAETHVLVNLGPYPSIEAAGRAETEVDWLDADTADDTVATECFAALELRRLLRKMTGRGDDFAVVDDNRPHEGDLILVGSPASNAECRRLASSLGVTSEDLAALGPEGYRVRSATIDGPYQNADVVRFWTLDVGKWCACDACKALGTRTDRNLLLVDRANSAIREARSEGRINRRVIIRFLAYADVLDPPSRPLARDFDYGTASATFFPIVRCYVHNFDDPACPRNARYFRQLDGWAVQADRHYRGELCIGEYYNVSGYRCLPICFMHTMANDIPFYHKVGARHFHYMHVTT